ncbi:MAG: type II secretion system protein [Planctomycetota bacterium]|nr:type II secretion system protein [Planctomycetota bacterium]
MVAGAGPRTRARSGFSLIDLLISIAVMVVLLSILTPALMKAQESARRVRCGSNVRQFGIAIQAYTNDYRDQLPPALFAEPPLPPASSSQPNAGNGAAQNRPAASGNEPQEHDDTESATDGTDTIFLRYAPLEPGDSSPLWDGLGILFGDGYLNHPGVFYCPSHHGDHEYEMYVPEWTGGRGLIASNYQYRVPAKSRYLSELHPETPLAADGMRTRSDYNHISGNNMLRADLVVTWFADVTGELYQSLPEAPPSYGAGGSPSRRGWDILNPGLD